MAKAKPSLVNRARFRKGDPLRDLHVARSKRLDHDEPGDPHTLSDALGPEDFDRDKVRANDSVVPEEELQ